MGSAAMNVSIDVSESAYEIAWENLNASTFLTQDERLSAPQKIREYIDALVSSGERDPNKIARSALGLIREFEQIHRSEARVASPGIAS